MPSTEACRELPSIPLLRRWVNKRNAAPFGVT
jgi:hypothetical protein